MNHKDAQIEEQVFEFIRDFWPYASEINLTLDTTMDDLGIAGIDAEKLMESYIETFNVHFPQPFDYQKYFAPETIDIVGLIKGLFKKSDDKFYSLKIRDFTIAAKAGIWHYP
ncbi:MAG: DUF1493 family protein [Spirosomaceae bacterium]|nr:DUF1493 family protein [Spirosomataceae bacterium]